MKRRRRDAIVDLTAGRNLRRLNPLRFEVVSRACALFLAHKAANDPARRERSMRLDAACGTAHDALHDAVERYLAAVDEVL
jgi:hypothetical protein